MRSICLLAFLAYTLPEEPSLEVDVLTLGKLRGSRSRDKGEGLEWMRVETGERKR